jgi:hypothetical protein
MDSAQSGRVSPDDRVPCPAEDEVNDWFGDISTVCAAEFRPLLIVHCGSLKVAARVSALRRRHRFSIVEAGQKLCHAVST